MTTEHTSKDFDHALQRARQLIDAIEALQAGSPALIAQILRHEEGVNDHRPRARGR